MANTNGLLSIVHQVGLPILAGTDGDPLQDITNTTLIRAVVANGRYFDRAALDQLLADVQTKAKNKPQPLGQSR